MDLTLPGWSARLERHLGLRPAGGRHRRRPHHPAVGLGVRHPGRRHLARQPARPRPAARGPPARRPAPAPLAALAPGAGGRRGDRVPTDRRGPRDQPRDPLAPGPDLQALLPGHVPGPARGSIRTGSCSTPSGRWSWSSGTAGGSGTPADPGAAWRRARCTGTAPSTDSGSGRRTLRTGKHPAGSGVRPLPSAPHSTARPPLSVLDLAVVNAGGTSAEALATTTAVAQRADALGYHRFWVAEHHNMPSVASTTPPVLMAHLAARTERIRIGSGGIMLPNHPPLVVAEHLAALEALHPGRIDLGLGRAPGHRPAHRGRPAPLRRRPRRRGLPPRPARPDGPARRRPRRGRPVGALHRHPARDVDAPDRAARFEQLQRAAGRGPRACAFAFAHHFDMGGLEQAVAQYRRAFRPSPVLDAPHLIVTANVLVADDPGGGRPPGRHRDGSWSTASAPAGSSRCCRPTRPPTHPHLAAALAMPSQRIVGPPEPAVAALDRLVLASGADELMVSAVAHGLDARLAQPRAAHRGVGRAHRETPDRPIRRSGGHRVRGS